MLFDDLRDLPDRFSYLDELGGAGFRMYFEASALGPLVGFIVTIDVAHRNHVRCPMRNDRMPSLTRRDQKFGSLDLLIRSKENPDCAGFIWNSNADCFANFAAAASFPSSF